MQLVTMEAERSQDFDREILELSKDVSDAAASELMKLAAVQAIEPGCIDAVIYRKLRKTQGLEAGGLRPP